VAAVQYIYTQRVYRIQRTVHSYITIKRKEKIGNCGPCPVFGSYTLEFALKRRKKHGKP
jgi:hypothetical protein